MSIYARTRQTDPEKILWQKIDFTIFFSNQQSIGHMNCAISVGLCSNDNKLFGGRWPPDARQFLFLPSLLLPIIFLSLPPLLKPHFSNADTHIVSNVVCISSTSFCLHFVCPFGIVSLDYEECSWRGVPVETEFFFIWRFLPRINRYTLTFHTEFWVPNSTASEISSFKNLFYQKKQLSEISLWRKVGFPPRL